MGTNTNTITIRSFDDLIVGGVSLNRLTHSLEHGEEVTIETDCAGETKALLLLQELYSKLQERYGEFGVLPHANLQFGDTSATFYLNKEFAKM